MKAKSNWRIARTVISILENHYRRRNSCMQQNVGLNKMFHYPSFGCSNICSYFLNLLTWQPTLWRAKTLKFWDSDWLLLTCVDMDLNVLLLFNFLPSQAHKFQLNSWLSEVSFLCLLHAIWMIPSSKHYSNTASTSTAIQCG